MVTPYQHVRVERLPSLLLTRDLREWKHFDLPIFAGTGGSFGAVLERGGLLAADHYGIPEVPDSVFEASLVSLADAVQGKASAVRRSIPLDHGALWGSGDTGSSDLVVVSDRRGIRGYDDADRVMLSLAGDRSLLGIEPVDGSLRAAAETGSGAREITRFHDGAEQPTTPLAEDISIRHRISRDVVIVAPDGKRSLIPHTSVARPAAASTAAA